MRFLLGLCSLLLASASLWAETFVYVSMGGEQRILIFKIDAKDGSLAPVGAQAVDGAPGSLAVDAKKQTLFASLRSTSELASYRIDAGTGKLTPINKVKWENAAYIRPDASGKYLLAASYAAGKIAVHELGADGSIKSPATHVLETAKTAHCVTNAPDGSMLFVPHVAPNAVYQFKLDGQTGKLTQSGMAPGGSPKAGPRHIAFHPKGEFAYTSDEVANSITAYKFTAGKGLESVQNLPTLPKEFTAKNTTAEVKVHPSGKFVWVSNRGHNSLAGFAIDVAGKLTSLGTTPVPPTPRSFEIEPTGKYLYVAGEGNGAVEIFRIDADTGKLTSLSVQQLGKSATWVMAVSQ